MGNARGRQYAEVASRVDKSNLRSVAVVMTQYCATAQTLSTGACPKTKGIANLTEYATFSEKGTVIACMQMAAQTFTWMANSQMAAQTFTPLVAIVI